MSIGLPHICFSFKPLIRKDKTVKNTSCLLKTWALDFHWTFMSFWAEINKNAGVEDYSWFIFSSWSCSTAKTPENGTFWRPLYTASTGSSWASELTSENRLITFSIGETPTHACGERYDTVVVWAEDRRCLWFYSGSSMKRSITTESLNYWRY